MSAFASAPASASGPVPAITVRGLVKRFAANTALDGIDLDVPFGEVTALVGRNGAGKSTLIRIIATLILPDEGTVIVDGFDVSGEPEKARRRLGLTLGEDRSFFWQLEWAAEPGVLRRPPRLARQGGPGGL